MSGRPDVSSRSQARAERGLQARRVLRADPTRGDRAGRWSYGGIHCRRAAGPVIGPPLRQIASAAVFVAVMAPLWLLVQPVSVRRAYDVMTWLNGWESERWQDELGRRLTALPRATPAMVDALPDTMGLRPLRVELLAANGRLDEARQRLALLPTDTPWQRFEREALTEWVAWWSDEPADISRHAWGRRPRSRTRSGAGRARDGGRCRGASGGDGRRRCRRSALGDARRAGRSPAPLRVRLHRRRAGHGRPDGHRGEHHRSPSAPASFADGGDHVLERHVVALLAAVEVLQRHRLALADDDCPARAGLRRRLELLAELA